VIDAEFSATTPCGEVVKAVFDRLWTDYTDSSPTADFKVEFHAPVTGELIETFDTNALLGPKAAIRLGELSYTLGTTTPHTRGMVLLIRPGHLLPVTSIAGSVQCTLMTDAVPDRSTFARKYNRAWGLQDQYHREPHVEDAHPDKLIQNWRNEDPTSLQRRERLAVIEMYAGYALRDPQFLTLTRAEVNEILGSDHLRFPYISNARAGISERYVFDAIVRWWKAQPEPKRSLTEEFFAFDSLFHRVRFTLCAGPFYRDEVLMKGLEDLLGERYADYYRQFDKTLMMLQGAMFHLPEHQPPREDFKFQLETLPRTSLTCEDANGESKADVASTTIAPEQGSFNGSATSSGPCSATLGILALFDQGPRIPRFPPHFEVFCAGLKSSEITQHFGFQCFATSAKATSNSVFFSCRSPHRSPNDISTPVPFHETTHAAQCELKVLTPQAVGSTLKVELELSDTVKLSMSPGSGTLTIGGDKSDKPALAFSQDDVAQHSMTKTFGRNLDRSDAWWVLTKRGAEYLGPQSTRMRVIVPARMITVIQFNFVDFTDRKLDVKPVEPPTQIEI